MKKIICTALGTFLSAGVFAAGNNFVIDFQAENLKDVKTVLQSKFEEHKALANAEEEAYQNKDTDAAFKKAQKALDILIKNNEQYAELLTAVKEKHESLYKTVNGNTISGMPYKFAGQMMYTEVVDLTELVTKLYSKKITLAKEVAHIVDHQYYSSLSNVPQNLAALYDVSLSYTKVFITSNWDPKGLFCSTLKVGIDQDWNKFIDGWLEQQAK